MSDKYWHDYIPISKPTSDGRITTLYLPLIKVEIRFPLREPFLTTALVDSGADCCLFAREIAEMRKVDFPGVHTHSGGGAGGGGFLIWEHPAELWFQGVKISIRNWTYMRNPNTGELGHNLLGREDFFKKFRVSFDQRKKRMEIRPYK